VQQAFTRQFAEGAERAVVIGTDCPGLNRRFVVEALTALAAYDVILGPAADGRCYLVGLRTPQPALFRGIGWSSGAVFPQLRARAAALGLRVRVLQPLRMIGTMLDARVLGLLNS
jgi:glycosyltransferase A (GT-A) superfamily protein (DUF2064 family)